MTFNEENDNGFIPELANSYLSNLNLCVYQKKNLTKLLQVNNGVLIIPPSLIENIHYYYDYIGSTYTV